MGPIASQAGENFLRRVGSGAPYTPHGLYDMFRTELNALIRQELPSNAELSALIEDVTIQTARGAQQQLRLVFTCVHYGQPLEYAHNVAQAEIANIEAASN